MTIDTFGEVRQMLRSGEVSLRGRLSSSEAETSTLIDEEVRMAAGRIDAFFKTISDGCGNTGFADLFSGIYAKMTKAYLRSKHRAPHLKITTEEWNFFWQEIQNVIRLFNEHRILVDACLLEAVMTYGGFNYWKDFFEEEFEFFADAPGIVRRAATHHPQNPREFLQQIKEDVLGILQEEEFTCFRDRIWIVQHAAVYSPQNPRAFLRSGKWKTLAGEDRDRKAEISGGTRATRYRVCS